MSEPSIRIRSNETDPETSTEANEPQNTSEANPTAQARQLTRKAASQEAGNHQNPQEPEIAFPGLSAAELVKARENTLSKEDRKLKKHDDWSYAKIRQYFFKGGDALNLMSQAIETVRGIMTYEEREKVKPNTALQANKLRAAELVMAYIAGKPTQIVEQSGPEGDAIPITFGQAKE